MADKENKADAIRKVNMKARQEKEDNERRLLAEKNENTKRDLAAKEISQRMLLEMKLQRDKQQAKELEIQRICSQSEELKDLERQLKIAYVNKERAAQHQEAMLLSKIENDCAAQLDWQMEKDRVLDLKEQENRERERRQKLAAQKEGEEFVDIVLYIFKHCSHILCTFIYLHILLVLQKQILEREQEELKKQEEALHDKKMIDDIIAKINMQDEQHREARQTKIAETRSLIEQFQDERRQQKEALAAEQRRQDEEIQAYNQMMQQRQEQSDAEKKRVEEEKKIRWKMVVEETQNQTQSKEEYDNLRNMLWEEEHEAKLKREEEEAIAKRIEQRRIMTKLNQEQLVQKKEMQRRHEEEEMQLVAQMLHKFKQDEQKEKLQEENRRLFKQRFAAEASKQLGERKLREQLAKEQELQAIKVEREREEHKQQVIAEAKQLLWAQHAEQLKGFLPPN